MQLAAVYGIQILAPARTVTTRASVCAAVRGQTAACTAVRRTPRQRTPVAASTAPRGQMTRGYRA